MKGLPDEPSHVDGREDDGSHREQVAEELLSPESRAMTTASTSKRGRDATDAPSAAQNNNNDGDEASSDRIQSGRNRSVGLLPSQILHLSRQTTNNTNDVAVAMISNGDGNARHDDDNDNNDNNYSVDENSTTANRSQQGRPMERRMKERGTKDDAKVSHSSIPAGSREPRQQPILAPQSSKTSYADKLLLPNDRIAHHPSSSQSTTAEKEILLNTSNHTESNSDVVAATKAPMAQESSNLFANPTHLATAPSAMTNASSVNFFAGAPPTAIERDARTYRDAQIYPGAIRMSGVSSDANTDDGDDTNDFTSFSGENSSANAASGMIDPHSFYPQHIATATIVDEQRTQEGGSAIASLNTANEAPSLPPTAATSDANNLEEQVREKILSQAVEAEVQHPFWTPTKIAIAIVIMLAILGGVVGALVATTGRSGSDGSRKAPPLQEITASPTTPSSEPSAAPTGTPTFAPTFSEEALEILDLLAKNSPDQGLALKNDPSSPQYRAFLWIISEADIDLAELLERYAMAVFYYSTDGDEWTNNANWLSPLHICEWWMNGEDSPCSFDQQLRYLDLSENNLDGTIPDEIVLLIELRSVLLNGNSLSGSLPTGLAENVGITIFDVSDNDLTGSIPPSFGEVWDAMTRFNVARNPNLGGPMPANLGKARRVSFIDMSETQISGTLPASYGDLQQLTHLNLQQINVNGSIPLSWWQSLTNLREWYMSSNRMTGTIPPDIANFTMLTELDFEENEMSGPLPSEIGLMAALRNINLGDNQFTGPIPTSIGMLEHLETFQVRRNRLNGTIPSEFGLLTGLKILYLSQNELTGTVSPDLFYPESILREFKASTNRLTDLPTNIGQSVELRSIFINSNRFSTQLPSEIGLLTFLTSMVLHTNPFSGTFPTEIGNLTNLRMLSLQQLTDIEGPLPTEVGKLTGVTRIRITGSAFTGTLPSELGQLPLLANLFKDTGHEHGRSHPNNVGQHRRTRRTVVVEKFLHGDGADGADPAGLPREGRIRIERSERDDAALRCWIGRDYG